MTPELYPSEDLYPDSGLFPQPLAIAPSPTLLIGEVDEVLVARQAFPDAQAALALAGLGTRYGTEKFALGWYGTRISEERGSFCIVNAAGPLVDLVGDVLRFSAGTKAVYAYCLGRADIEFDVAVTRRPFAALATLSTDSVETWVEIVA